MDNEVLKEIHKALTQASGIFESINNVLELHSERMDHLTERLLAIEERLKLEDEGLRKSVYGLAEDD